MQPVSAASWVGAPLRIPQLRSQRMSSHHLQASPGSVTNSSAMVASSGSHNAFSRSAPPNPTQGVSGAHRLFVYGMPEGLNADMLRGHFARHGEILDIYNPNYKPDIAYITFTS